MLTLVIPLPKEEYDRLNEYKYAVEIIRRILDSTPEKDTYINKTEIINALPKEKSYG